MLSAPRAVFCFFALLNVLVLNNVPLSNDPAVSSQDVRAIPRHLSEVTSDFSNNRSSHMSSGMGRYHYLLADVLFTKHSDNAALLSELRKKEWLFHEKYYYDRVSNRDMVAMFDLFNQLYVMEHSSMMKRLSDRLSDLSKKYRMPDKETRELWKECKQDIESKLNRKMDFYKKDYNSFVMSNKAKASSFASFYKKYVKAWYNGLQKSEKKWNKIFAERASKYGVASPKQKA